MTERDGLHYLSGSRNYKVSNLDAMVKQIRLIFYKFFYFRIAPLRNDLFRQGYCFVYRKPCMKTC